MNTQRLYFMKSNRNSTERALEVVIGHVSRIIWIRRRPFLQHAVKSQKVNKKSFTKEKASVGEETNFTWMNLNIIRKLSKNKCALECIYSVFIQKPCYVLPEVLSRCCLLLMEIAEGFLFVREQLQRLMLRFFRR